MPKASDLKRGMVIELNGMPYSVKDMDVRSPSSRGANTLYKVRFINLKTGQKLDETFKGEDFIKDADCQRLPVQFSYIDGDSYVFMNTEDYSQYHLNKDEIEDQIGYITDGMEGITALIMDGEILGIELPASVTLQIIETAPAIKGASATSRTKPAKLSTGLEVQVPEYLANEEMIKVNTSNGKFMSRA